MRVERSVAAALWLFTCLGAVVLVVGTIQLGRQALGDPTNLAPGLWLLGVDAVVFAAVGALPVSRQPGNRVGRLPLVTGPMTIAVHPLVSAVWLRPRAMGR